MATFPKRVDLDEASISQLTQLYQDTYKDLHGIIITMASTGVTVRNVQQARGLIQQRIQQLANDNGDWINKNVPQAYATGQTDAVAQLKSFNNPITDFVAAGVIAGGAKLAGLHDQAINAIQNDMSASLSGALTGMARSADKVLSDVQHQAIKDRFATVNAETTPESTATNVLKSNILKSLDENGIYAITDKAGRKWQPDVYAENLARTSLTSARNTALSNALASQKYDLVQVSSHGATDVCGDYEGAILSLNGQTDGYDTVDDATAAGLFHNNCQHALSPCDPDQYPTDQLPYTADELDSVDESDLVGASLDDSL